ncbi:hypothetical protein ABFT23_05720 [Nocardioides sp. C4-1]|uniref:hypothetical protein n=1 Tax=Nocardioides sp. C4-1 TaxID=3151851 RepID=UPI0032653748
MDDAHAHPRARLIGVAGLLVFALVAAAAVWVGLLRTEEAGDAFVAGDVSPELRGATIDLVGTPPAGPGTLEDVIAAATASVEDMSTLDAGAYAQQWGRSAHDQAALVGQWLGLASAELGGADADRVREAAAAVGATAPDEPGDNPGIPGSESLRSTLQAASSAAGG